MLLVEKLEKLKEGIKLCGGIGNLPQDMEIIAMVLARTMIGRSRRDMLFLVKICLGLYISPEIILCAMGIKFLFFLILILILAFMNIMFSHLHFCLSFA